jgi:hypothetical protein
MRAIIKAAVMQIYQLLWLRDHDIENYAQKVAYGRRLCLHWDDPDL